MKININKLVWEEVESGMNRTPVPNGWIVQQYEQRYNERTALWDWQMVSAFFVPDETHTWNNQVEEQYPPALFAPFDDDGILCVQNGKITTYPDEDQDWTEYHLEKFHGDVWRIERSDAAELCSFVYQGKIPNREYFVSIMNNQEIPLPNGWENN